MKAFAIFTTAASLIATTNAHGAVDKYIVGDTVYEGYVHSYVPSLSVETKKI
jgi:hypothetical protein